MSPQQQRRGHRSAAQARSADRRSTAGRSCGRRPPPCSRSSTTAEQMRDRIVAADQRDATPQAERCGVQERADRVADLPDPRLRLADRRFAAVVLAHLDGAHDAGKDDEGRARPQPRIAGLDRCHQRGDARAERAEEHRRRILEKQIDKRRVNRGRDLDLLSFDEPGGEPGHAASQCILSHPSPIASS